ncbi:MAG TPA: GNAT family protein [Acidimicrobiales bacterium]|nr:GNAT family protein [Acidimicrobiales bacterium]
MGPELAGYGVVLAPIVAHDADALAAAASSAPEDAFRWTFVPRTAREWSETIAAYETTGRCIFTVRAGNRVVGVTGYYDLDFWSGRDAPDACEVGHTWYVPKVRGTTVNPACKLLLFTHAFDTWGVARIAMRTDARNVISRAAMRKLGMTFEGIRRRHMLGADGTFRDSAYFSAVPEEWPAIKRDLEARLS